MSGPSPARKPNRLIDEKSAYLLQHANNPVDWYPWGDEAFTRAAELDRPVLLSIGYSACHWCHVMEEESFDDDEVAKLINDLYVAVKVDREERPDIDAHYMSAAQLLSGGGGWPLTVFLTPERQPFYAATYIPKEARFGMVGLMELLPTIANHWRSNRSELTALSQKVRSSMREQRGSASGGGLGEEALMAGFQNLMESFDEVHGGFGSSPKFPTPHRLTMLLRYWHRTNDPKALWMVDRTLEAMRKGGIYDQVGKGFHRYSTDRAWSIPHYEKMLYDQALLALAYLEGYQATGREVYALTAQEVLDNIIEDFAAPEGGFCSAFDADSEGMEGAYYLWSVDELASILSPSEMAEAGRLLGIAYEGGHCAALGDGDYGKGTLYLKDLSALSNPALSEIRSKLLGARRTRVGPARDDKVMVDWTGLAIAALARGYVVLGETAYLRAANKAVEFVMENLRAADGGLLHLYREGPSKIRGFLDDYAFMAWGLIELYQAGHEVRRMKEVLALVKNMNDRFWDDKEGGYFMTSQDTGDELLRRKEVYDGAVPSGNSVALLDLVLLYRITEEPDLAERIDRTIIAFSGTIFHLPDQYAQFMCAVDFKIGPSYSVVISGEDASEDTRSFFRHLAKHYVPNKVVLLNPPGRAGMDLGALSPLVHGQVMKNGRAVAHVCTERNCLPETIDPVAFADLFRSV